MRVRRWGYPQRCPGDRGFSGTLRQPRCLSARPDRHSPAPQQPPNHTVRHAPPVRRAQQFGEARSLSQNPCGRVRVAPESLAPTPTAPKYLPETACPNHPQGPVHEPHHRQSPAPGPIDTVSRGLSKGAKPMRLCAWPRPNYRKGLLATPGPPGNLLPPLSLPPAVQSRPPARKALAPSLVDRNRRPWPLRKPTGRLRAPAFLRPKPPDAPCQPHRRAEKPGCTVQYETSRNRHLVSRHPEVWPPPRSAD